MESEKRLSTQYGKEKGILVQYMDFLYEEKGKSASTAYNYYMVLRSLAKFLLHRRHNMDCDPDEVVLHQVDAQELLGIAKDEWWDYLDYYHFSKQEMKGSFAVRISIIHGFFKWLCAENSVPMPEYIAAVKRPKANKQPFITVTERLEDVLCSSIEGNNSARNICIIRVFLRCGLGLQEICNLDLEDIELKSIVVRGENRPRRIIPLDDTMVAAINTYVEVRNPPTDGSNAFFVSATKGRLHRGAVQKMLRKVVAQAGPTCYNIKIRDLQLTAKARIVRSNGLAEAARMTNISSPYYFRQTYGAYAPKSVAREIV